MSDYISREQAIEEINKYRMTSGVSNQGTWNECVDVIAHTVSELPSADFRENKGDLISRQAVLDAIEDDTRLGMYSRFASNNDAQCFKDVIRELPSVENKGEWIYQQGVIPYKWRCNKCEKMFKIDFNFCPNCGADMRGEK